MMHHQLLCFSVVICFSFFFFFSVFLQANCIYKWNSMTPAIFKVTVSVYIVDVSRIE